MNLDELKKLSEIFVNFAQPIATVVAAVIGVKMAAKYGKNDGKRKRKKR